MASEVDRSPLQTGSVVGTSLTENLAEGYQRLGNVVQEPVPAGVTGEMVGQAAKARGDAITALASGISEGFAPFIDKMISGSKQQQAGADYAAGAAAGGGLSVGGAAPSGGAPAATPELTPASTPGGPPGTAPGAQVAIGANGVTSVIPSLTSLLGGGQTYSKNYGQGLLASSNVADQQYATQLHTQYQGDPEGFKNAWNSYVGGRNYGKFGPEFGTQATLQAAEIGGGHYNSLVTQKASQDLVVAGNAIQTQINGVSNDMSALARGGQMDSPAFDAKQDQLQDLYGQLGENPHYTGNTADELNKSLHGFQSDAITSAVDGNYQTGGKSAAIKAGQDAIDAIPGLSDAEREDFLRKVDNRVTYNSKVNEDQVREIGEAYQQAQQNPTKVSDTDLANLQQRAEAAGDYVTAHNISGYRDGRNKSPLNDGLTPSQVGTPTQQRAMTGTGVGPPVGTGSNFVGQTDNRRQGNPVLDAFLATGNPGGSSTRDWCADYVAACVKAAGGQIPSKGAVATEWANWGSPVDPSDIRAGDVVVNRQGTTRSGGLGGHVAIATGPAVNGRIPVMEGDVRIDYADASKGHQVSYGTEPATDVVRRGTRSDGGNLYWGNPGAPPLGAPIGTIGPGISTTGGGPAGQGDPAVMNAIQTSGGSPQTQKIMTGIFAGESAHIAGHYDTNITDKEESYGPFQLNRKGGLGAQFESETGLSLKDPSTIQAQAKWVAGKLEADPSIVNQFYGYAARGKAMVDAGWGTPGYVGGGQGGGGAPAASGSGSFLPQQPVQMAGFLQAQGADDKVRKSAELSTYHALDFATKNGSAPEPQYIASHAQLANGDPEAMQRSASVQGAAIENVRAAQGQPAADAYRQKIDQLYQGPSIWNAARDKSFNEHLDQDRTRAKEHPLEYAQEKGIAGAPTQINYSDPNSVAQGLAQNAQTTARLNAREPGVSTSAVPESIKPQVAAALVSADPQQAVNVLNGIAALPKDARDATTKDMAKEIVGATKSGDPVRMGAAYTLMDQEYRENPMTFDSKFGDGALSDLRKWQDVGQFQTTEKIAKDAMKADDPGTIQAQKTLRTEADELLKKTTTTDVVNSLASTPTKANPQSGYVNRYNPFGADYTPISDAPGQVLGALKHDYDENYKDQYAKTANADAANKYALEKVGLKWGQSDANGGRFMAYPPERSPALPAINGDKSWIGAQLGADVAAIHPDGKEAFLVPDQQTQAEMTSGKVPSYQVVTRGTDGSLYGLPKRWAPDPARAQAEANATFGAANANVQPQGGLPGVAGGMMWAH